MRVNFQIVKLLSSNLPDSRQSGTDTKCDVLFLGSAVNSKDVPSQLLLREGIDLQRQLTIRNCNTLRKLHSLADAMNK
jgi:hypothetical protein